MEAFDIVDRMVYGAWQAKPGDKLTQTLNLLLILASLWLFRQGFRRARSAGAGAMLALALVGFLLLSTAWSIDPGTTIRRGVLYLFVVLGSIGIAGTLDSDELMDLVVLLCGICVGASLVILVISPTAILDPGGTGLRGVFTSKNALGQVMAIAVLASLHGIRASRRGRLRKTIMLIVFILVAFASKSATSWLTIFIFCSIDGIITLYRKGGVARFVGVSLIAVLGPITLFQALFPDVVLEMIGKDPTLTGRTVLWAYVMIDIAQRPFVGWGYYAFWSQSNPAATEISDTLRWYVPEAHNGLLEILLNVGFLGAAFFIFLWIRNVSIAWRCMRTTAKNQGATALLLYIGIVLIGIAESMMIEPFQPTTGMFFMLGLICERALRSARRAHYKSGKRSPGLLSDQAYSSPLPNAGGAP